MVNQSKEQVMQGLLNYADREVVGKLPTTGRWLMGTAISLASAKANDIADTLVHHPLAIALGVVDEDGNIDVEMLMDALHNSADRYGNMTIEVPMVGRLTFSSSDVDRLKTYIV